MSFVQSFAPPSGAASGGAGGTLQASYDGGRAMVTVLPITIDNDGANSNDLIQLSRAPGAPQSGDAIQIVYAANANGVGIRIQHAGGQTGIDINMSAAGASGEAIAVNMEAATTAAGAVVVTQGSANNCFRAIMTGAGGVNQIGYNIIAGALGVGFNWSASSGAQQGLRLVSTGTHANNTMSINRTTSGGGNAIQISMGALSVSNCIDIEQDGTGDAINIEVNHVDGQGIVCTADGAITNPLVEINVVAEGVAVTAELLTISKNPNQASTGAGASITMGASTSGACLVLNAAGSGVALEVTAGQSVFANGSVALPSVTFAGSPTTGLSRSSNNIAISNNATLNFVFDSGGFIDSANAAGPRIYNRAATDVIPTVVVNKASTNTGWGAQAAGLISGITNGAEVLRLDQSAVALDTRFLIYDVDNGQLERVSVGAADSGGTNFKVLRIPN